MIHIVKMQRNKDNGTFSLVRKDQVIATYTDYNECVEAFRAELSKDHKRLDAELSMRANRKTK